MKKLLLGLIALPLVISVAMVRAESTSAPTATDNGVLRADHPQSYTVVSGDTLWSISGRFLSQPWMWKKLWHMNPDIKNPDLIYPGDVIKLVYIDGQPRLTVDHRGTTMSSNTNNADKDCTNQATQKKMPDGVIKLSPKCHATELGTAIPPISLEAIGPFLSDNRVVTSDKELLAAPRIVAGERVAGGQGDSMFARGHFDPAIPVYDIYRVGRTFRDPVSNEELGLVMRNLGRAKIISPTEDISRIELVRTREEVLVDDRLIPAEEASLASYFLPQAPEKPVSGVILDVIGSVDQVGQFNVVLLSKGERDGLASGAVLAIYHEAGVITDPVTKQKLKLPSEKAGLLMVFRTFEKMSYGIVLQSDRPLAVMDEVRNP